MDYRDPTEIANWEPVPRIMPKGYRALVATVVEGGESMAFRCDDDAELRTLLASLRSQCERNFKGEARVRRCAPYVILEVL